MKLIVILFHSVNCMIYTINFKTNPDHNRVKIKPNIRYAIVCFANRFII